MLSRTICGFHFKKGDGNSCIFSDTMMLYYTICIVVSSHTYRRGLCLFQYFRNDFVL